MKLKIFDWLGDNNYTFKDTWHWDFLTKPCSFKVIHSDELNHIVIYKR